MNPGLAIPTIDVAEAERRLRDDPASPLLVDVREANEFEAVRAPGAVLVPMSAFAARRVPLKRASWRARAASTRVRTAADDVVNVAGGMDAWERAGLPVHHGPPAPGEGDLPG